MIQFVLKDFITVSYMAYCKTGLVTFFLSSLYGQGEHDL